MSKQIFLQQIIENNVNELPNNFSISDLESFGLNWKLFGYQKEALENAIKILYLYFNGGKENLYHLYTTEGLTDKFEQENLWVWDKEDSFELLKDYFPLEVNNHIKFKEFVNRASFWMATGSGKTLIMVKLMEILHRLMRSKSIPVKDIMLLAPKDEILKQIQYHIDIYNKKGEFFIDFRDLRDWEKLQFQSPFGNYIRVFYYRADNITDENKDKQIDYKTFYNNGNWYLILDEAHKGVKATSKRQQYFAILSKNGFLFNFSATFTDNIDIVTTAYDFKLDRFLQEGYGKKIYIANSEFKNFKPEKKNKEIINDFQDERKNIILQTLIILALAKKHSREIKKLNSNLYHSPLLVTVANSVNTDDADLKIFYELLSEIALRKIDFKNVKKRLVESIERNREYAISGLGRLNDNLINDIENLNENDFYENVFNTKASGTIEVIKFKGNTRELAFRVKGAGQYFGLIHASDVTNWQDNVLEGYEIVESVESGIFIDINKRDDINILLGSRIFIEGWDSNRPNIINFINIGVSEDAKKFVLQTIGRGLRIEPVESFRKRFKYLNNKESILKGNEISIIHINKKLLESLFIFATNKEVIKNIIEDLEKQSEKWINIKSIKKNPIINEKELPLYIPIYENNVLNNEPYEIHRNDKERLSEYIERIGDKLLVLKDNVKIRTLNKLKNDGYFKISGKEKKYSPEFFIKNIDSFWNKLTEEIRGVKILEDEINHYKFIETNLIDEIEKIEAEIKTVLQPPKYTEAEIDNLFDNDKINREEYKKLIKELSSRVELSGKVDYKIFNEHYYIPLLLKQNSKNFKHIVKIVSEIEFLRRLAEYAKKDENKLNKYDWWYFSKLDESIDNIKIPYFDTSIGDYRYFCPDFIFWLKKDDKYYIKFIDPKGIEHTQNPSDKAKGFEKIKNNLKLLKDKKMIEISLFFFNDKAPDSEYKKYWTNDFDKIF